MKIFKIIALLLLTSPVFASTHYIRAGATGTGTGADWTNACTAFTGSCTVASMVRGDTWYVAGGSYAGPSFNKAVSGTTLITINTATVASHGTATGWSDSFVSLVTFTGGIDFTTGFWVLDGQTGGGPTAYTTGFGLSITQTAAVPVVEVDAGANNVTIRHASLFGTSNSSGGGSIAQDAFAIKGASNFTASFYYTNAIGRCPFFCGGTGNACPALIAEFGDIGTYVSTSAQHSEVMSTATMSGDIDFRYNLVTHIEGTGGIMWDNSGSHTAQLRVYGNTFYRAPSDSSWANTANGIIGGFTGGNGEDNFNMQIFNNNFVNVNGTIVFTNFILRFGGNVVENNMFYNTTASIDYTDIATHDYNYYNASGTPPTETHGQSATGDPFVSDATLNFEPTVNTTAGLTLASPYTTDPAGVSRGVPAAWTRGGFQFVPSTPTVATPTASPVAGTYATTQSVALSTTTAGAAICYTTDGTTPTATTPGTCSHGTTYSSAISVPSTETILAIGTLSGDINSSLATLAYTITGTTWYIRPDGGTATQCTGKTNAAYPGSGTGVACALSHPYWMMNSSGGWAHMVGGDTIQFVNTSGTSDTYYAGEQNGGLGFDWAGAGINTGECATPNSGASATGCILPAPPSGTVARHTRLLGQNAGSCHDSARTHLVNPTILSGISGAFAVLDTRNTEYVDISCIEITQPDNCTNNVATGQCATNANYVRFGGLILNYTLSQGPSNLTMNDIAVVGLASNGFLGSKINKLSGDVFTASDIYIIGNGQSGWNGDSGGCGNSCETVGTMNLSHVMIDWNGCVAVNPYNMSLPDTQNKFNFCYDDATAGYGDGFVQVSAGAMTLNVDQSTFRWNTQDGFDALHMSDDPTGNPGIIITRSYGEGNEGQNFKLGGGQVETAINDVSIHNCMVMQTASNFPLNPSGWNNGLGDFCRPAGRNQWAFQLNNNTVLTLENNTSIGYGTTMYDIECSQAPGETSCASAGAKVLFNNNLNLGFQDPGNSNRLPSGIFLGVGVTTAIFSGGSANNLWHNMFATTGCPDSVISPTPTNSQCGDPLLVAESNVNAINANLTVSSPANGNGEFISGIPVDYNGNNRPNPPSIGAYEFVSSTVANPVASPVAGSYAATQVVTLSTTTSGAVICYTIDGTTPTATTPGTCSHGTTYSAAITVATSQTITALGTLSGDTNSSVVSFAYVIAPAVATPTASPVAGSYSGTQSVTLSSTTSGATICYTVDGTTPTTTTPGTCSHGTTYSTAISVATSQTIKALGTKAADSNSSVASFAYTITPVVQPIVTFSGSFSFGGKTSN